MFETHTSRVLQIFYPAIVFFALILSWNTVGQVRGFGDGNLPAFNLKQPKINQVSSPLSCSVESSDATAGSSCQADGNGVWTLLGNAQENTGVLKQASFSDFRTRQR